jgi:hypothetical protein
MATIVLRDIPWGRFFALAHCFVSVGACFSSLGGAKIIFASPSSLINQAFVNKRNHSNIDLLDEIIQTLREQKPLAPKHRDHELTGDYAGF